MGWAFEMSAWFALTEGRYEQLIEFAQAGQSIAGPGNAGVQLILQEARGWSRLRDHKQADAALTRGAAMHLQRPDANCAGQDEPGYHHRAAGRARPGSCLRRERL